MVAAVDPLTRCARNAGAGDAGALNALIVTGYEPVWRLCATLVDPQSADDLAQETFTRVVRALPTYRGESSARTWLLSIARHVCLDELRARSRRRRRDTSMRAGPVPTVVDASADVIVADLVARLDPDRRAAFVLTQVLGLSYEEAARVCECPPGTIRSRVARARADLIELLSRSGQSERRQAQ
jgi:RNA polymerase sigma-70 factor (ECF subfamily)